MRVIVIGGGVIGAATAHSLAARGAAVTLLESRTPGAGASQASAGILAPYVEAKPDSPLLGLGARSLALYDEFIARTVRDSGREVEYARTGTLQVAFDREDADAFGREAAWLASVGIGAALLDAAALRGREPAVSHEAVAGLAIDGHGFVAVPPLVAALVHAARRCGARVEAPVEVTRVTTRGDAVQVTAADRTDEADAVVLAGGSWSGRVRVEGAPRMPVRPVRGQLLHVRAEPPVPAAVTWGPDCYVVPWRDGTLLVGATVEEAGFDERSTVTGVRDLSGALIRLLPRTGSAAVESVRVGLRPATPDDLPVLGPVAGNPRIVVAAGHYRNGILLAPLTADIVTRLLIDGDSDEALGLTDPGRFAA